MVCCGPFIGLTVPALLILGNKTFGISSSLRHVCAACFPSDISFFKYNWKKEIWNLVFVLGIAIGGVIAIQFLENTQAIDLNPQTVADLQQMGIKDFSNLMPADIFDEKHILTLRGLFFMVIGGFLVGFGTRYAGGCTSGHAIMGLSNLQWPSLVATISFMVGGIISAWFVVPFILSILK